jgi:glucose-6-phosphate 1-dehydrogenase
MEDPNTFTAENVRREKERILDAIALPADLDRHTACGQYAAGLQGGVPVVGYLDEEGIPDDSTTDTFAAIRLDIETRRWAGVPFYLRTGKRLGRRVTEVAVVFKRSPHSPFGAAAMEGLTSNAIVFRIQPDEGVTVRFGSKIPSTQMEVRDVNMDFQYGDSFAVDSPEAYERLILDVLLGSPPLFPRQREVERSWEILDPVLAHWAAGGRPEPYTAGGWGPPGAYRMMEADGRVWRRP